MSESVQWETAAECLLRIATSLERKSKEQRASMEGIAGTFVNAPCAVSLALTAAAIRENVKKCAGCGRHYHPDWGSLCPNCTGAD